MRILVTIPHFYRPAGGLHGSGAADPMPRLRALSEAVSALHRHFGEKQRIAFALDAVNAPANQHYATAIDVVVRTAGGDHLLPLLDLPAGRIEHRPAEGDPRLLGFTCHEILRERFGQYDVYGYMEDDLILHDPLFFAKLAWFTAEVGEQAVLLPHRFETSPHRTPHKFYIDGDNPTGVRFTGERDRIDGHMFGRPLSFVRALNPHAGCFFLSAGQMTRWLAAGLEVDTSFVGPLESAATLHLLKHFHVFKPAVENAAFLELQHFGQAFIDRLA